MPGMPPGMPMPPFPPPPGMALPPGFPPFPPPPGMSPPGMPYMGTPPMIPGATPRPPSAAATPFAPGGYASPPTFVPQSQQPQHQQQQQQPSAPQLTLPDPSLAQTNPDLKKKTDLKWSDANFSPVSPSSFCLIEPCLMCWLCRRRGAPFIRNTTPLRTRPRLLQNRRLMVHRSRRRSREARSGPGPRTSSKSTRPWRISPSPHSELTRRSFLPVLLILRLLSLVHTCKPSNGAASSLSYVPMLLCKGRCWFAWARRVVCFECQMNIICLHCYTRVNA